METEIESAGYQDLRDYIQANWTYIAVEDNNGNEVLRLTTSDARVSWVHSAGAQTLELELTLNGDDSDINLPQDFKTAKLYPSSSSTTQRATHSFSQIDFETTADQAVITFEVNVPTLA